MTSAKPIPMVDLREQYQTLKTDIDAAIADVLDNTQFIMGPNVHALEQEIATYLGVSDAIGCANGTDALHLALLGLGIGPGDEVITTPFTFIATAEAIAYVGATPVFVDIEPDTYNLDVSLVEQAITERTRAVIPVHLFGLPCDMQALQSLASKHNLLVVEDCAQSLVLRLMDTKPVRLAMSARIVFFRVKTWVVMATAACSPQTIQSLPKDFAC